jgi:hypothetical protein
LTRVTPTQQDSVQRYDGRIQQQETTVPKAQTIILVVVGAIVLLVGVAALLLSRVDTKSRFEALASDATGLDVTVKGSVSIGLFPTLHVALKNVTMNSKESQIASLGQADVDLEFWPLLRKQVRITHVTMREVNIDIARERNGHFNFSQSSHTSPQDIQLVPAMRLGRVSFTKTSIRYTNRQTDKEFKATDCNFDSNDLQLAEGRSEDIMKHLLVSAQVECAEMRNNLFVGNGVHFTVAGKQGIFKLTPVTMQIMGGKGSGSIDADFTDATPEYRVHFAVTQLHVDNLFKSLAPGKVGEGFMDFTADLSMRGFNTTEMIGTAQGEASLLGKDLDVAIGNLDEKLAHYESSQNFNLVDVGAFFIVGPLGAVVTKGYNFASIFQGADGNTHIGILVSQWKVEHGVAHAQDVAMATKENRLAMKGALDFVNRDFDDVTVIVLDHKGCARIEQRIRGPFSKPEIEKPNVLVSLAGPISRLIDKTEKLMGKKCQVVYAGSVQLQ